MDHASKQKVVHLADKVSHILMIMNRTRIDLSICNNLKTPWSLDHASSFLALVYVGTAHSTLVFRILSHSRKSWGVTLVAAESEPVFAKEETLYMALVDCEPPKDGGSLLGRRLKGKGLCNVNDIHFSKSTTQRMLPFTEKS